MRDDGVTRRPVTRGIGRGGARTATSRFALLSPDVTGAPGAHRPAEPARSAWYARGAGAGPRHRREVHGRCWSGSPRRQALAGLGSADGSDIAVTRTGPAPQLTRLTWSGHDRPAATTLVERSTWPVRSGRRGGTPRCGPGVTRSSREKGTPSALRGSAQPEAVFDGVDGTVRRVRGRARRRARFVVPGRRGQVRPHPRLHADAVARRTTTRSND